VVAKVVIASPRISLQTTGSGTHAIAIGSLDDAGGGGEGGAANGIIFWPSPETEDDEIRFLALPPRGVADVGGRGPDNRVLGGDGWRVAGGFARRVDDQPGLVAQFTKGLGKQPQIPMPKKLVLPDGQIGIKKNLQISGIGSKD